MNDDELSAMIEEFDKDQDNASKYKLVFHRLRN